MADYDLAFIGAGNMAEAIARGVIDAGVLAAGRLVAADPSPARREVFDALGAATSDDTPAAAASAERILLAVKPQVTGDVLESLAGPPSAGKLVVSIAAGVSTARIEAALGGDVRVVRVMPNTPMLVGAGTSGLAKGSAATDDDLAWARRLFDAAGRSIVVDDEALMEAVTAVSGSGPAYFFYLVQYMVDAGVAEGLTGEQALELAAGTAVGAAKLLAESGEDPAELRRKVTSPGGTTQAACDLLDARGVPQAIVDAVRAAAARGRELGG